MELYNRINRKTIKMSKKLITDELNRKKNDQAMALVKLNSHDEEHVRKVS